MIGIGDVLLYREEEKKRLLEEVVEYIYGEEGEGEEKKEKRAFRTFRIYFWDNEPVFCPPAVRKRDVMWSGELRYAKLYVELEPKWGLTGITFNGVKVWEGMGTIEPVEVDVLPYVQLGENDVRLDYIASPWCVIGDRANCLCYLTISDDTVEVKKPTEYPPWIHYVAPIAVFAGIVSISAYVVGKAMGGK